MNSKGAVRAAALFLTLIFGLGTSAGAQSPPETTGDPKTRAPEVREPAQAPIEQPNPPAPPAGAGERTMTVSRFTFTGNTVFPIETLQALVADYAGRPLTLLQVYEAADKVTDFYASNGYTLALVTVPAQRISGGSVRLEVIEGRIATVKVEGHRRYSLDQFKDNFDDFKSGQIYRGGDLADALHRLNRLPGLSAKAVLQPGAAYGTSDLIVQATEHPYAATLGADNYGRETLGEIRGSAGGTLNNPFRLEDQLQLLVMNTQGGLLQYGFVGYSLPIWKRGPRFSASYSEARFEIAGIPVEGENRTARGGLEYLFLDTRSDVISTSLGVSHTDANADLVGIPISETTITLYELSSLYSHVYGTLGVTQAQIALQSNFGKQERSDCPGPNCDEQRLRAELDLQHLQPIYGRLDSYVRVNYVYSPDPLPDVTLMTLGGPNSVRGYPTSEVRGDRGVFGSAGLRQGLRLGPTTLHLRLFVDSGEVERIDPVGVPAKDSLSSAGVGADFLWGVGGLMISAKADWSFTLDNHTDDPASSTTDEQRLFATIAVGY